MSTRKFAVRAVPGPVDVPRAAWDGSAPVPSTELEIKRDAIGGAYEPLIELAAGGMARVFVGRRTGASGFERLVVIKQVHPHLLGKEDFANYFRDEARIASLIHHANVVPIVDVVDSDGGLLLVMDYVESVSLALLTRSVIEGGEVLPADVAVRVLLDALAGLHAAHELVDASGRRLDVVHRDVSPQNLIVGVDGVTRVIDFGIAKAAHRLTKTESGHLKGKYAYMSPEQIDPGPVDRRADVFAAGVVLYEMLTGTRLFAGENAMDSMRRILHGPPPPMIAVPASVRKLLLAALDRAPARRPRTAAAFADLLEAALPPASHRRVAECIARWCGPVLAARREMLDTRRQLVSTSAAVPIGGDEDPTAVTGEPPQTRVMERGDVATGRPPRAWRVALAAGVGVLVAVALLVTKPWRTAGAPAPPATALPSSSLSAPLAAAAPEPASASVSVSASAPIPAAVTVSVTADAAILAVRTPGLRQVKLDGTRAELSVEPQGGGPLRIEADLAGKRTAHALVAPGEARATLVTDPPRARPAARAIPPARPDDLQADPYR